jgi:hypothetical protein
MNVLYDPFVAIHQAQPQPVLADGINQGLPSKQRDLISCKGQVAPKI